MSSRFRIHLIFLFIVLPVVALIMGQSFVRAIDISISASVPSQQPPEEPQTIVTFKGLAYPGSDVTIKQDGTVRVTVPADPQARFEVSITDLDAGSFTFSVSAKDAQGREGREMNFTLTITKGTTTTISGIFLGPTIEADKQTITIDETITFLGTTAPRSTVNVFVQSEVMKSFEASADESGLWAQQILGTSLTQGSHEAFAKATAPDGSISDSSKTVTFQVTGEEVGPCDLAKPGDISCDGYVNLVDFSILLYWWNSTNPGNPRADINQNGIVNIVDFSIMLYYWS